MGKNNHLLPRMKRERFIRRALLSIIILSVLVVLIILMKPMLEKRVKNSVVDTFESETIVLDELVATVTTVTDCCKSTTTISSAETTTMETTTTTDKPNNEGSNVVLNSAELETRFVLGEDHLNHVDGTYDWMSSDYGRIHETFYSTPIQGIFELEDVKILGFTYADVAIRDDGVRCIKNGNDPKEWLVIVAMNLERFPRGTYIRTSLGFGIVLDTAEEFSGNEMDIAVSTDNWGGTENIFNKNN